MAKAKAKSKPKSPKPADKDAPKVFERGARIAFVIAGLEGKGVSKADIIAKFGGSEDAAASLIGDAKHKDYVCVLNPFTKKYTGTLKKK